MKRVKQSLLLTALILTTSCEKVVLDETPSGDDNGVNTPTSNITIHISGVGNAEYEENSADTTPIQRQISCNIQNDNKTCVNANIYSI